MKRLFGLFSLSIGIEVIYQCWKAFSWGGPLMALDMDPGTTVFEWYIIFTLIVIGDALRRRALARRLEASSSSTDGTWTEEQSSAKTITGKDSFFDVAARLSLITPIALALAGFLIGGFLFHRNQHNVSPLEAHMWLLTAGLIWAASGTLAGVISLLGLSFHRRDSSLWIALAGIVVSAVSTVLVFFIFIMGCLGHNC